MVLQLSGNTLRSGHGAQDSTFITFYNSFKIALFQTSAAEMVMSFASHLQSIMRNRDDSALDSLLLTTHRSQGELPPEAVELIKELILADWHKQHEDLARTLQRHKKTTSVSALERAAQLTLPYLVEQQTLDAFHRKCTWALADIGTLEARNALIKLSRCDDIELAGYAQKRLDQWGDEIPRKSGSSAMRA